MPKIPPPFWRPDVHADRRPRLLLRGAITRAVRGWFEAEGFIEVETAALQVSPGNEAHLHAFSTEAVSTAGDERAPLHLRTSPEFAAKKLLAAGEHRIFELARVWRNRERGRLHSPEFTMLEWYRAGEPYTALMDDSAALLRLAAEEAGARHLRWKALRCDPHAEPERLTLAEAFDRFTGVDLLKYVAADGSTDREGFAWDARRIGVRVAGDDSWSDVFSRVLVDRIEPNLGDGRPTILCEYPICEAALARPKSGDPRVAERFELYACGVELANAFGELTDPEEQRRRFEAEMDLMQLRYAERLPLDEELLAALAHMPEASGAALGFDRLVMLATGATEIDQVLWTPVTPTP